MTPPHLDNNFALCVFLPIIMFVIFCLEIFFNSSIFFYRLQRRAWHSAFSVDIFLWCWIFWGPLKCCFPVPGAPSPCLTRPSRVSSVRVQRHASPHELFPVVLNLCVAHHASICISSVCSRANTQCVSRHCHHAHESVTGQECEVLSDLLVSYTWIELKIVLGDYCRQCCVCLSVCTLLVLEKKE